MNYLGLGACMAFYGVYGLVVLNSRGTRTSRNASWVAALSIGFFTPDDSVKLDAASIGLTGILLVAFPLMLILPTLLHNPIKKDLISSRALAFLAAMFAWIVLTLPLAASPFFSAGNTVQALVATLVAVRLVSLYPCSLELLLHLARASLVLALSSWLSYLAVGGAIGLFGEDSYGRLMGSVPYVHPNALAFVACLGACALLGLRLSATKQWVEENLRPAFFWIGLPALVVTCVATWTRSTTVVLAIVGLSVMLLSVRGVLVRVLAVTLLGAAIVLVTVQLPLVSTVQDYLQRGQTEESLRTLNSRTDWWASAVTDIGVSPWGVGVGLGGHRIAAPRLEHVGNLDSTWTALFVNAGYVSVSLFLGFWVSLFGLTAQGMRHGRYAPLYVAVVVPSFLVTTYNPSVQDLNYVGIFVGIGCLGLARNRSLPEGDPAASTSGHVEKAASLGNESPQERISGFAQRATPDQPSAEQSCA